MMMFKKFMFSTNILDITTYFNKYKTKVEIVNAKYEKANEVSSGKNFW